LLGFYGPLQGLLQSVLLKQDCHLRTCYNVHIEWSGYSLWLEVLKVVDFWDEGQKTPSQSPHNFIWKQNLVGSKIRAD